MKKLRSPFDIVMVWYQNDWGVYNRRNEAIARTLLKNDHIRNVLHIEPPLDPKHINSQSGSNSLDRNVEINLKRLNLYNDKGVYIYTPQVTNGMSEKETAQTLQNQLHQVMNLCQMQNILLWLYPPHPFVEFTLSILQNKASLILSDCVDDHRQYAKTPANRNLIENRYREIVTKSDIVFCVSRRMRDEIAKYNSRSFYIPNAVSSDILINRTVDLNAPSIMPHIQHPIIGYTGALSLRIDTGLLRFVAESKPEWNIVLIGTSPASDVRSLFELPNIHWLGPMQHNDLHQYIQQFDVCIIPHLVNPMTDNMNPLKVYEYLAHGKPIVSTDVSGIKMFSSDIDIAYDKEQFLNSIQNSLENNTIEQRTKRIDRVRCHTWTARIDEMMKLCLNTLERKDNSTNHLIKKTSYYSFDRPEVRKFVPNTSKTILDVGCAAGCLGAALKRNQDCFVIGVENDPEIANRARDHLDDVIVGDIEKLVDNFPSDYFDCIILADVLEHLSDPERLLKKLKSSLKEDGKIVASIPNVRHWSVLQSLLEGKWEYEDAGILDRTHLKFFTKSSILKMFYNLELDILQLNHTTVNHLPAIPKGIDTSLSNAGINTATLSEEVTHYQYIVCAEKRRYVQHMTSIIVLTFNQLKYTKECVASIIEHTPEPHEIIFVDNGSQDGTVKWLRTIVANDSNYKLIENNINLGFSKGCNQGIKASRGDHILLLNNDVVVTQDWLAGLLECLHSETRVGIVGPMTNSISGPQRITSASYGAMEDMHSYACTFRTKNRHRRIPMRRIVGFCMLFRKELVDTIGMLDESFGSGNFEDDDFSLRAMLAGYKNMIAGDVFIHHYGSRSFIGNRIDYSSAMAGNGMIFREKWNSCSQRETRLQLHLLNVIDKANQLHQSEQTDKAIDLLLEGLKVSAKRSDLYIALAEIFIDAKQPEKALEVLDQAPGNQSDTRILELTATCKENLNHIEEAEVIADRLLDSNPSSAFAMNLKGLVACKKGSSSAARDYFERAIACDPSFGEPYTNLGILHWESGQREESLKQLERGFLLSPISMDVATSYLSAATELGELTNAEISIREALVIHPFNKRLRTMLVDVLLQHGKHSEAMEAIEDLIIHHGHDEGLLNAALAVREKAGPLKVRPERRREGTLSVCMIVKNEEKCLAKCLSSVKPLADEMIVVDTGSEDRTKDVGAVFGAKVHDFNWTGDFAEARNFSLSKASCDWILVLDADEVLSRRDHERITRIIRKRGQPRAYSLTTRNYVDNVTIAGWEANKGEYPEDEKGRGWVPSTKVRLFPNDRRIRFHHKVHELVEPSIERLGIQIRPCDIPIHHYGKLNGQRVLVKDETYYDLGLQKLESNTSSPKALVELAKAASAIERHHEAVKLWQEVIRVSPRDGGAYFGLGSAQLLCGDYREAMSSCETALALDENLKEAAYNYSLCAVCSGENLTKAITILEKILDKNPDYPPALGMLGTLCIMTDQRERGLAHIQRLKQLGFSGPDCFYQNAKRLVDGGRPEEAVKLLQTALETDNGNLNIMTLLAQVFRSTGSAPQLAVQAVS